MNSTAKHDQDAATGPVDRADLSESRDSGSRNPFTALNRKTAPPAGTALEESGERYWQFKEDWTGAFPSLVAKGD